MVSGVRAEGRGSFVSPLVPMHHANYCRPKSMMSPVMIPPPDGLLSRRWRRRPAGMRHTYVSLCVAPIERLPYPRHTHHPTMEDTRPHSLCTRVSPPTR